MSENKKNVPRLRFPGFTDAWEQRKLPDFVDFFSGLTYTPDDVREDGTLVLRSSNVKNGEIVNADNVYVNPEIVKSENVQVGDIIVVVRNGSRALIGKHAEIKENMPNTVIGAFMSGLRSENPDFVNALLDTSHFAKEVEKNMGATINQITGYMFAQMEFHVPLTTEQKKIGALFGNLDGAITLYQRKLDAIKEYKSGMLQKMFPKEGETVPEVRFPEFTDAWEQRKFKDISDKLCVGFVGTCEKYYTDKQNGIPMYRTGNIKDGVLVEDDMKYVTREFHEKNKKSQLKQNDIVIARFGENGLGALYLKDEEANCLNCIILHVDERMSPEYVKHYMSSDAFRNRALANTVGSTFSILNTTTLGKMDIPYTNFAEQKKIGEFLTNLEKTITLHQRKLDAMKELKKGLLQQMFV